MECCIFSYTTKKTKVWTFFGATIELGSSVCPCDPRPPSRVNPPSEKKKSGFPIHSPGDLLPQPAPSSPLALAHAAAAIAPSCFLALLGSFNSDPRHLLPRRQWRDYARILSHEWQLLDTSLPVGDGVLGPLRPPAWGWQRTTGQWCGI